MTRTQAFNVLMREAQQDSQPSEARAKAVFRAFKALNFGITDIEEYMNKFVLSCDGKPYAVPMQVELSKLMARS